MPCCLFSWSEPGRGFVPGKIFRAAFFSGVAIAVKLVPWPIIIFLMLRRNWRATCAAATTIAIANVAAAMLIGFDRMAHYYLKIGSSVSGLYHAHSCQFFTLDHRLAHFRWHGLTSFRWCKCTSPFQRTSNSPIHLHCHILRHVNIRISICLPSAKPRYFFRHSRYVS